jgi:hypothetical protein
MIWQFVRRASVDFLGVSLSSLEAGQQLRLPFLPGQCRAQSYWKSFHLLASMILAVEKAISIVRPNVVSVTLPLTDLESKTFRGMEGDMTMHDPEWQ